MKNGKQVQALLDAVKSQYDGYRWSYRVKYHNGVRVWKRLVTVRDTTYSGDWNKSYDEAKKSTVRRCIDAGEYGGWTLTGGKS